MTRFIPTTALTLGIALSAQMLQAAPGYTTQRLEVAHRDTALEVHLWYPTTTKRTPTTIGANAVFTGTQVLQDAAPFHGSHPLIVLSHGSGGNAANLGWIAGDLAERGFVVAAANHPGTTSRDSIPQETVKIWERPADLSALIDAGLSGGFAGLTIDPEAIGALGFSLGGYSVLSLAGATVTKDAYTAYCRDYAQMMDCQWLRAGGVVFEALDDPRFEQSNRDARLTAVISVDPALSQAFDPASLAALDVPVQLINLGVGTQVPAAIDAAHLAPQIPQSDLVQVADASHFSFLGLCGWKGQSIVWMVGEDPICTDPGPRDRSDIHRELRATIGAFFERSLSGTRPQG